MLEMAILETQIFNIFWGSKTPDILRTVVPTALVCRHLIKILILKTFFW